MSVDPPRCPECGRRFDPFDPSTYGPPLGPLPRGARILLLANVLGLLVGGVVLLSACAELRVGVWSSAPTALWLFLLPPHVIGVLLLLWTTGLTATVKGQRYRGWQLALLWGAAAANVGVAVLEVAAMVAVLR